MIEGLNKEDVELRNYLRGGKQVSVKRTIEMDGCVSEEVNNFS